MRIESKFMKANVRITSVALVDGKLVTEGMIKKALPVRVEMTVEDVRDFVQAIVGPLRQRLADRLPSPLSRFIFQGAQSR